MYKIMGIHFTRWAWLYTSLSFLMRTKIYPKSVTKETFLNQIEGKAVIYVFPRMSIMDTIVLNKVLKSFGLKKIKTEAKSKRFRHAALLALKSGRFHFSEIHKERFLHDFIKLLRHDPRIKSEKIIFMPVSVFWSRAPERNEKGFFLRSLFPDDGTGNALQKLFMLILHRGEVNVSFGKTITAAHIEGQIQNKLLESTNTQTIEDLEIEHARRIRRQFNIEFAKERTAAFGPTLYDNDKICQWVLSSPSSKKFISSSDNPIKTEEHIVRYIHEIGANYNYLTIRALEKFFDFIWTKIFEGVRVRNFESVERSAKDGQVIWMPCHRSHFDYLLLNYVLFKKGFVVPHIAAGINLNFWPIGSILRRGGAFFIRRSFSGNKAYAHTFAEYVNYLLQNSFPVEFFQEGGRSRIGKLLSPKTGMLNICIQSIIKRKAENTYIIPVYFGYDKVMEDDTYAKELKGAKKQKENAFQFLNGIRKIFTNYGSVDVSFGEPIQVGKIWSEYINKVKLEIPKGVSIENGFLPQLFNDIPDNIDYRSPQIQDFVKHIANRVNQKINSAATASATSILATCLLTQPVHAFINSEELQCKALLINYLINSFAKETNWKVSTTHHAENILEFLNIYFNESENIDSNNLQIKNKLTEINFLIEQTFKMGERWELMEKITKENSEINYKIKTEKVMNLWWYRGTIFHVLAPFGIIAHFLLNTKNEDKNYFNVEYIINNIRKIWYDELFWDTDTSSELLANACINILIQINIIKIDSINNKKIILCNNDKAIKALEFLSKLIEPEIELYGIQVATAMTLIKNKGYFTRDELLQKSITSHTVAYSQALAHQPPIFSKVFATRAFDAFFKNGIYTPKENQKFSVNPIFLSRISSFLNLSIWSECTYKY
jgi:glycerol-3-phosphate O-acyltransferase